MEPTPHKILCILPVYNGEGVVDKAIYSILNQSYKLWHLVVIDDGSNDNTGKILNQFSNHNQVTILNNKTNKGTYYSINKALHKFKDTDWTLFTVHGADDTSSPNRFACLLECFYSSDVLAGVSAWSGKTYIPSKVGITYKIEKQTANYVKLNIEYPVKLAYIKGEKLAGKNMFENGLAIYSRKVFNLIGYFDSTTRHSGDIEYLHRLYAFCKKNSTSFQIKALDPEKYSYTYVTGFHKTTQNLGQKYNKYIKEKYINKTESIHFTSQTPEDFYYNFNL
jgi:glycosyltransferase involved in cell wall biosynthesis